MPTKTPKPKAATQEIGETGTIIYNGTIIQPDENRDLVGNNAIKTYNRMRRSDATIKGALKATTLPILSSTVRVDAASDSAQDKEIADRVKQELTGMTRTFPDFLREALLCLPLGHYVFEIVYELKDDGFMGLHKLAPRLPETILAWETTDGKDGITQMSKKGQRVSIPIEKLLIFTLDKEGDNWLGESILRSAYKPYYMKENLEKIDAIAHERSGVGIPWARPNGNPQEGDKDKVRETLANLRGGEEAHVYIPSGWEIDFFKLAGSQGRSPLESMQYHRFEILLNFLATFLALGSTDSGSRALSTDLSDFFEMSLKYIANTVIAAPINQFLIKRLVDLNYNVKEYPKLSFDGIGKVDFTAITEALVKMNTVHSYTPELSIENTLRRAMGLPEAPDDAYYPDPSEKPVVPMVAEPGDKKEGEDDEEPTSQEVKASQSAYLDYHFKREEELIRRSLEKSGHAA